MKILIVRNDNIGDLICTTPAIEALKKKYSNYQIDIVVNSYNFDAIYKNTFVDNVYCYTKPKHKKNIMDKIKAAFGKLKILYKIRKENYDSVIVMRRGYSKSAEIFSKITNAKYKIGVQNKIGKDDYNIHVEKKKIQHEVEFCFDCLDFFNVKIGDEKTRFFINDSFKIKYNKYSNYIGFHISARMNNNQMSYNKLLKILEPFKGEKIIITAEPKDYDFAFRLESELGIKFVETDSFIDLGGLFSNLKHVLTLEGGAMHLAPAVGTKTAALFGQSEINRWYPWGYKDLVIQDESKIAENINISEIIEYLKKNL